MAVARPGPGTATASDYQAVNHSLSLLPQPSLCHGLAGDRHVDPYVAVTARQDCLRVEAPRRIPSSEAQKGNPTRELSSSKVLLYGT